MNSFARTGRNLATSLATLTLLCLTAAQANGQSDNDVALQINVQQDGLEQQLTLSIDGDGMAVNAAQYGEINMLSLLLQGQQHQIDVTQSGFANRVEGLQRGQPLSVSGSGVQLAITQLGSQNIFQGSFSS